MGKINNKAIFIVGFFQNELPNAEMQQKLLISALYPHRGDFLEKTTVKLYVKLRGFCVFFPSSRNQVVHWIIIIICQQEAKNQDKTDHTYSQTKP